MRGRFSGVLLVLGAILITAGVFPTWVTVGTSGTVPVSQGYNGFTVAASNLDAIVSFVVAGILLFFAFTLVLWAAVVNRFLSFVASIAAILWAGILALVLGSSAQFVLTTLAPHISRPAVAETTTYGLGYYLTAGGAVIAFLGGMVALAARRRRAIVAAEPAPVEATGRRPTEPATRPAPAPTPAAPAPAPSAATRQPVTFPPDRSPASGAPASSSSTQPQIR